MLQSYLLSKPSQSTCSTTSSEDIKFL